jgi:hypothetical protein
MAKTLRSTFMLQEASIYLRLSPEVIIQQVELGHIPGQRIDKRIPNLKITNWFALK